LYMTNMFHPVKMGLTNMRKLHNLMENPMDDVGCPRECGYVLGFVFWLPDSHSDYFM
jgi:hypothetical protein